ncbi:cbb3-type cytochrome oxidase subunit 3 [Pseudomonas aegrilactucae]|uniref:CcoQ/FixQ family Cbb3-type cytochrome c oxidase assembly chaperone n=1 Tax=Pseudomonas aegrilactucae TaxID=2854028 RepID=A0A9Q3AHG8_9PSED|nr:CcoQ/FixQ family Cbb3-type cytochrome c oxidase assembly chaperone [Pseudomonas aegrilactucae]MBV6290480.1 CcoQ/FixQ family Cbb3-type cytochrome c oxidase assembly chaperone [Pseudomonas aegrilactucae]
MDFTLDIGQLRGLGTLLVAIAFIGLALWVFSGRRDREFAEASLLPFADEHAAPTAKESESRSNGQ